MEFVLILRIISQYRLIQDSVVIDSNFLFQFLLILQTHIANDVANRIISNIPWILQSRISKNKRRGL